MNRVVVNIIGWFFVIGIILCYFLIYVILLGMPFYLYKMENNILFLWQYVVTIPLAYITYLIFKK